MLEIITLILLFVASMFCTLHSKDKSASSVTNKTACPSTQLGISPKSVISISSPAILSTKLTCAVICVFVWLMYFVVDRLRIIKGVKRIS